MRPTATDAARSVVCVCLSVCWARDTRVCCTQTDEPIEMPFGGWGLWADSFGSRERCVWWGQDRTNPLAAEGWQVADAAFVKLLWLDCSLNVLFIVCVWIDRQLGRAGCSGETGVGRTTQRSRGDGSGECVVIPVLIMSTVFQHMIRYSVGCWVSTTARESVGLHDIRHGMRSPLSLLP